MGTDQFRIQVLGDASIALLPCEFDGAVNEARGLEFICGVRHQSSESEDFLARADQSCDSVALHIGNGGVNGLRCQCRMVVKAGDDVQPGPFHESDVIRRKAKAQCVQRLRGGSDDKSCWHCH